MWQPIETAPKDGSFILLATPKGRIADGFWSLVYGVWSWPYVMVEPTHWMPLPELPGAQAQPAPSVPREAINKMLTQLMDIAVSNGANSVSMPDEYVEVAAWLCGIPAQPAPSVPEGWKLVPIEPTREMIQKACSDHGYPCGDRSVYARGYRTMLAAAPEIKS